MLERWWLPRLTDHMAETWLSLLLTYFMHALVWAAAAALIARARGLSSATKNAAWKLALLGPIATATLVNLGTGFHVASLAPLLPQPGVSVGITSPQPGALPRAQGWAWATFAAMSFGCLRLVAGIAALRVRLRERQRAGDARAAKRLAVIAARFRLGNVELSESARIDSPLLVGPREVCIPAGGSAALSDAELDAIFAHELAHAERRDWLWFPVAGLIESVLWFQPINHWVAEHLRRSAELACDDRAVELTRAPRALAAALARMATQTARRSLAPAMGSSAKAVVIRVRRLVTETSSRRPGPWAQRVASLGLLAAGATTLGVDVTAASVAESRTQAVDVLALNAELTSLLGRESEIQAELSAAESLALDPDTTPRVLELRQELSHVRERERWTEERFSH